jgi:hypothetical protein
VKPDAFYTDVAREIGRELADRPPAMFVAPSRLAIPPTVPEDRLTEATAADRFARLHGEDVRFDHRRDRYLLWHRHHWIPDADAAVTRLALDFARDWQRAAVDIPDREKRANEASCVITTHPAKNPGETGRLGLKTAVPGRFAGVSKLIRLTNRCL